MRTTPRFRSSIPRHAEARITEWHANGAKSTVEYFIEGRHLKGRLRRGYPKYFVAGGQVSRRQYIKAAASDASLPPFRKAENRPRRRFPPVIARHLGDHRSGNHS